jgi:hypothetical protein
LGGDGLDFSLPQAGTDPGAYRQIPWARFQMTLAAFLVGLILMS